jgi:hypothetical protein
MRRVWDAKAGDDNSEGTRYSSAQETRRFNFETFLTEPSSVDADSLSIGDST